jgi:hypothetical protein
MTDNVSGGLPNRGKTLLAGTGRTLTDGDRAGIEGTTRVFNDVAPGQAPGAKVRRSNRQVTCMLVQNTSGIALLPKRLVSWASGLRGKRVDGYVTTTAGQAAGVVDEHLPAAGVADNDYFWLAVRGPSLMLTSLAADAENVISLDDTMVALTAATSQATTSSRVITWGLTATSTQTTNGGLTDHLMNQIGNAMSAKTTANTNADVLVDLEILK